jgi:hypothetical protein
MSHYFRDNRAALGALDMTKKYVWNADCKCINTETGMPYPGDQRLSNCTTIHGSCKAGSKGGGAVWDFFKQTFLPQTGPGYGGPGGAPTTTASNLLIPAVAVVGVVGLFLILKKKK